MKLSDAHRSQLLALARQSIEHGLADSPWSAVPPGLPSDPLARMQGSFVTLRTGRQLRGCCGTVVPQRSLYEDVWRNAWASAFGDPRFSPLASEEWADVHIHLSVLSPLERVPVLDEQELLQTLRPHVDGLLLERDHARATFLPDVWDDVPDPADFVRHLKQKAGWPANAWSPLIKVWRYTTESFGERPDTELQTSLPARRA